MTRFKIKCFVVVFAILASFNGFSQEEKNKEDEAYEEIKESLLNIPLNSVIEMDIDKSVFPIRKDNAHFAEDQITGIMAILMPSNFKKLEEEFRNEESKAGSIIIDRGELENEGERILFLKQSFEHEGKTYYMFVFAKEFKMDATIMVTASYESNKDNEYKKHSEKAIKSAVVVEKE